MYAIVSFVKRVRGGHGEVRQDLCLSAELLDKARLPKQMLYDAYVHCRKNVELAAKEIDA